MPPFDDGVPALVLRLDRNPFHHGTLGAVRSLGRAGVEVHAVVESADSPVARSCFLHRAHPGLRGTVTPEAFVEMLLRVSDRIGRRAVLVAMDDVSAILAAAHTTPSADRSPAPPRPTRLRARPNPSRRAPATP
ncbi:ATP-grasp domain-containing protein, partial [Streptomyces sp. NPDC051098]